MLESVPAQDSSSASASADPASGSKMTTNKIDSRAASTASDDRTYLDVAKSASTVSTPKAAPNAEGEPKKPPSQKESRASAGLPLSDPTATGHPPRSASLVVERDESDDAVMVTTPPLDADAPPDASRDVDMKEADTVHTVNSASTLFAGTKQVAEERTLNMTVQDMKDWMKTDMAYAIVQRLVAGYCSGENFMEVCHMLYLSLIHI